MANADALFAVINFDFENERSAFGGDQVFQAEFVEREPENLPLPKFITLAADVRGAAAHDKRN